MAVIDPKVFQGWAERYISVETAEATGQRTPWTLKEQLAPMWHESRALRCEPAWDVTVQPRQIGKTVTIHVFKLALIRHVPGLRILEVYPDDETMRSQRERFDGMIRTAVAGSGLPKKGRREREDLFIAANGSFIRRAYVGKKGGAADLVGRGDAWHLVHLCEMAFWARDADDRVMAALVPAMERSRGGVIIDSTPPTEAKQGETYRQIVRDVLSGRLRNGRLFFGPWWKEPTYRADVPALDPLSDRERHLMESEDIDFHQVQWRRDMMTKPGMRLRFRQAYPESIADALGSNTTAGISEHLLEPWHQAAAYGWPEPLSGDAVLELLAEELISYRPGDPLITPAWPIAPEGVDYCRVWIPPRRHAPEKTKQIVDRSKSYTREDAANELTLWAERSGQVSGRFFAGLDPSWAMGDPHVLFIVDDCGDPAAYLRSWAPVQVFAADAQRLLAWFDAEVWIEMAASGRWILDMFRSAMPQQLIDQWGLADIVGTPYTRVREWHTTSHTRPNMWAALVAALEHISPVDAEMYGELLRVSPGTGKTVDAHGTDDICDAFSIAQEGRRRAMIRAGHRTTPMLRARVIQPGQPFRDFARTLRG